MKQLTFEICCKYPNAKYLHPCDRSPFEFRGFKHPTDDIQAIKEKFFVVLYGDWSGGTNPQYSTTTSHTYISDCKLVLTPLSKISDGDCLEWFDDADYTDEQCIEYVKHLIHSCTNGTTDEEDFTDSFATYLRSKGYNCDPYELVFGENCIDKTTLNQTV